MPHLNFETLDPISTGKIFISTFEAYNTHEIPQTQLSNTHAFHTLWANHWSIVTCPGISDNLIDAFLALSKEDPSWIRSLSTGEIVTQRSQIRRFLRQGPPDVILVSGGSHLNAYSFHSRREPFAKFICISKQYVDLWTSAIPGTENELALRALLHTCIDHETAHWIFTLVFIISHLLHRTWTKLDNRKWVRSRPSIMMHARSRMAQRVMKHWLKSRETKLKQTR